MKILMLGFGLLVGSLLGAPPDETKVLDRVRETYRESALVVRAKVMQEGEDTVLYPTENWRSAPGYEAGRMVLPRLAELSLPEGIEEVLACFYLQTHIGHYELFYVKDGHLDMAPSTSLQFLRQELEKH